MTKADLIARISTSTAFSKAEAERSLNALLDTMQEGLASDGKIALTGFGSFTVETRKEREGRNPRTGEAMTIAASRVVRFRPGKMLKDAVK